MRVTWLSILAVALLIPAVQLSSQQGTNPQPPAKAVVDFEKDVQPIFKTSCYACHSGSQPQAGLRLDVKSMALKGSNGGAVILPGNSKDSSLIHRVTGLGGLRPMPLTGPPLTADQIAILTRWVDAGATWPDSLANEQNAAIQRHWAYVKPVRPAVPAVKDTAWVRNPIDAFVLARLEQEKLPPTREASKETLIRRVSLDLIGLPPSPAEVDAFLADTRPDAYERLVDRLLASPQHGERMATPWLDLARYADSAGNTNDTRRLGAYRYRDWVIAALNANMPFDKFIIEQMAGDMLPDATNDQKIATGFVRSSMWNDEGGTDPEEQNWITQNDRTSTIGTALLGSTVGCAQCHNHKYDPFLQKDYYALMAFFNNAKFDPNAPGGNAERKKWTEMMLELTTPEQAAKRDALKAEIKTAQDQINSFPDSFALWQAWEKSLIEADKQWTPLHPTVARATAGSTLTVSPDGSVLVSGDEPDFDTYVIEATSPIAGTITGIQIEALPHASLDAGRDPSATIGGPGRDFYGNFKVHRVDVEVGSSAQQLAKVAMKTTVTPAGTDENGGFVPIPAPRPGRPDVYRIPQMWQSDVLLDLEPAQGGARVARRLVVVPEKPVTVTNRDVVRISIVHDSEAVKAALGNFRIYVTTQADPYKVVSIDARMRPLLGTPWEQRAKPKAADAAPPKEGVAPEAPYEKDRLFARWREVASELAPLRDKVTDLQAQVAALGIVATPILAENVDVAHPTTQLRIRGAYTDRAEEVAAAVPGFLGTLPKDGPQNRMGLAQWIVGPDNPLTARVRMNQIWQIYFGRGIVETTEDFGTQGSRPSHPELLDWLATEFVSKGWDQNAMTRLIVTSSTYRQSSAASSQLLDRDQANVLLARGPRFRVESEMLRDITLAASGLLSSKMGGVPVMPPQPLSLWVFPSQDADDEWIEAKGEDRYRRALYTFVRRTARYPSLTVFDAPSREYTTVRRPMSDTPLQALTALNDPAFFEAAQGMAQRIIKEGGSDVAARASYGYRLVTSRKPVAADVKALVTAFETQRQRLQKDPGEATALAGKADAELAAWTVISNALLNLDSTVTKE